MSLSTKALVSVAEVSDLSNYTSSEVEFAINYASAAIANYLGRVLEKTEFLVGSPDLYQGSARPWLLVRHYPIISVSSVKICGSAVTDYKLIPRKSEGGQIYRFLGWPRYVGGGRDLTRDSDHSWADYTIELAYAGGYVTAGQVGTSTVPADLAMAAKIAALSILENPTKSLVREKTPGGWEQEFQDVGSFGLPSSVLNMVAPYRSRP